MNEGTIYQIYFMLYVGNDALMRTIQKLFLAEDRCLKPKRFLLISLYKSNYNIESYRTVRAKKCQKFSYFHRS